MKVLKAGTGITVLFLRMPTKLVSVRYMVKCGAIDEHKTKEFGLCHALEHMFFAGTKTRNWEEVLRSFRNAGSHFNAFTSSATTEYEIMVPKEFLESAFEVLSDVVYNATFPEERWQKVEKGTIINELLSYESSPEWFLEVQALTHALGGPKKFHHPGGRLKSVKAAKVKDLVAFKDRFYSGDNVFLAVTGDLTEEEVLSLVGKYDRWDPTPPEPRAVPAPTFNMAPKSWVREGCGQPLVYFLKPVPKVRELEKILAAELTMELLNNHLFMEIREKRGLCYSIESDLFADLPHLDYLYITTATSDHAGQAAAQEEIQNALVSFFEVGLTSELIHQAKMDLYRKLLEADSSPRDVSAWMAQDWLLGSTEDRYERAQQKLKTITDETIIEAAQTSVAGEFKITTLEDTEDYDECSED